MRDHTVRHERPAGAVRSDRRGDALPRFGLNRFDVRSVDAFAADVRRAEALGWDAAFLPDSQLRRRDTYVLLAAAARATERIALGPLLANPVTRHPTVTASSMATIDELAPGRTLLGWGVGDTAVRLAGLRPARVVELEAATRLMRGLLDGQAVEVGAARPARLPHHRPVPIWIAAGGPRTLRMAGGVADGVFLRVGTHPANIGRAVELIRAGAAEAGRDPAAVGLGAVFHTVLVDEPHRALTMARSMAAGYYEYSPALFDPPGLTWPGPHRRRSSATAASGPISTTRPTSRSAGASSTSCRRPPPTPSVCAGARPRSRGSSWTCCDRLPPPSTTWCSHPIPNPPEPDDPERGYMSRVAREVLPRVRSALAAQPRDPAGGGPHSAVLPLRPAVRRDPAPADDLGRDRAVVERLAILDHPAEVEQQPGLGEAAEEQPVHRPDHPAGRVHAERAEEVLGAARRGPARRS